jgi:hypothetical protein
MPANLILLDLIIINHYRNDYILLGYVSV